MQREQFKSGKALGNGGNVAGSLKSQKDVIQRIVKIQALIRGVLARRYVQQVYGFQATASSDLMGRNQGLVVYYQAPNYDNQLVQSIKA